MHQTVRRAIHGTGPLRSAARAAEEQLREQDGDVDAAIRELIENNTALAAVEGFVTNLGGLVTLPATIPANIAALSLLQCRLVAGIAHLRGYDLSDDRVRNAIMLCTLGEDAVQGLARSRKVPGSPMLIATAPAYDPELDKLVAGEVTAALVGRVVGKRAAIAVIRRTPVAGGVWGAAPTRCSPGRSGGTPRGSSDRALSPLKSPVLASAGADAESLTAQPPGRPTQPGHRRGVGVRPVGRLEHHGYQCVDGCVRHPPRPAPVGVLPCVGVGEHGAKLVGVPDDVDARAFDPRQPLLRYLVGPGARGRG